MLTIVEEQILPNALLMGIDYELFWTLNPKTIAPFNKAFQMKVQAQDEYAWRQGIYIQHAIASVMDKRSKYPKTPLLHNLQLEQREEDRARLIKERFLNHIALQKKVKKWG